MIDAPAVLPKESMQATALETVIATLVENAGQAGAAHVRIAVHVDGGRVRFDIVDDGAGIPAGDRDRIFDPFFTGKREKGGTGLGLPIARALVSNGRGWLELADSSGGTHFVLSIPYEL
ncbi:MAG: HAMP domain-containing sensor histidine kinase [Pseudomonadota bacterium]